MNSYAAQKPSFAAHAKVRNNLLDPQVIKYKPMLIVPLLVRTCRYSKKAIHAQKAQQMRAFIVVLIYTLAVLTISNLFAAPWRHDQATTAALHTSQNVRRCVNAFKK